MVSEQCLLCPLLQELRHKKRDGDWRGSQVYMSLLDLMGGSLVSSLHTSNPRTSKAACPNKLSPSIPREGTLEEGSELTVGGRRKDRVTEDTYSPWSR